MRQVVIAFSTTGKDPKAGAQISELVATEHEDGHATGRTLHMSFAEDAAQDGTTFAQQFDTLDGFIMDARIVVFNATIWRKFMRAELRSIKKHGARRLLMQTFDVSHWARQRLPRQRKDLGSIAKKLGVNISSDAVGLARDVAMLSAVAAKVVDPISTATSPPQMSTEVLPSTEIPEVAQVQQRSLVERLALCWQVLVGRA